MPAKTEQELSQFFIGKAKESEPTNIYDAKSWLLTGRSMLPKNFNINLQFFLLEKRVKNVEGCARCFVILFEHFPLQIIEEVNELANAVKAVTLSTTVKETEEEAFLYKVFNSLPIGTRMEVLMHRSEHTPILLEKCQSVLLMVKLFPDVVNQHGGNMLYTLSGCDADVHSPFRSHLVTELVPAVLKLCQNLQPSPALITLLNQCIEYYVLVDTSSLENCSAGETSSDTTSSSSTLQTDKHWDKLYLIVDQIGTLLSWKISPFFRTGSSSATPTDVETLFQGLSLAIQHRTHYSSTELAYISVVIFLRCITSYYEKLTISSSGSGGGPTQSWKLSGELKSKLTLVEVFMPTNSSSNGSSDLPVITSISPCASVSSDSSQLLTYFITAAKTWTIINQLNSSDRLKKEFLQVFSSIKSLNFDAWPVFQEFQFDYLTYTGNHHTGTNSYSNNTFSSLKLSSMLCSLGSYQASAEHAIRLVNDLENSSAALTTVSSPTTPDSSRINPMSRTRSISTGSAAAAAGSSAISKPVNFSFFTAPCYAKDNQGYLINQRRVHFISDNKSEIIAYAVNVLIYSFQQLMERALGQQKRDQQDLDKIMGHLMVLLQMEWYSQPGEWMLTKIVEVIKGRAQFKYFPWFGEYVIEPDILEQFMAMANNNSEQPIALELFSANDTPAVSSSRRMGTRGGERGAKNDFKAAMRKQIFKNARTTPEQLITKFLMGNKAEIINCLEI